MKKNSFLLSILFVISLNVKGQVTPKSYLIGASSSFLLSTVPSGQVEQVLFGIQPTMGKFASEKWMTNVGIGYNLKRFSNGSISSTSFHTFTGSFGMTRFYPVSDKMYITLDFSIGGGYSLNYTKNSDTLIGASKSEGMMFNLSASPGLSYFLTKKWMLFSSFGGFGYSYSADFDFFSPRHVLGYNFQANSFGIGARFIIGTEK